MPVYNKVQGAWRELNKAYDKVQGVWRETDKIYDKVQGVWRECYSSGIPLGNLSIGTRVKFGNYFQYPIIWKIIAKNHLGYPANSITLHTEKIIDLRCFDAKEPNNPNRARKDYGNNRYAVSNLHQWLNKDAAAGSWYTAQHAYDQSPSSSYVYYNTPYDVIPGFLYAFSVDEKLKILSTTIRTVKPNTDGGSYEDIVCKVFLPSRTEIGLGNENSSYPEGTAWGFYTNNSTRIAHLTTQAYNNTLSNSKPLDINSSWFWWLRTPNPSDVSYARLVNTDGTMIDSNARYGDNGVRPVLNLLSTLMVSNNVDADGCYIVL